MGTSRCGSGSYATVAPISHSKVRKHYVTEIWEVRFANVEHVVCSSELSPLSRLPIPFHPFQKPRNRTSDVDERTEGDCAGAYGYRFLGHCVVQDAEEDAYRAFFSSCLYIWDVGLEIDGIRRMLGGVMNVWPRCYRSFTKTSRSAGYETFICARSSSRRIPSMKSFRPFLPSFLCSMCVIPRPAYDPIL